MNEMQIFKDDSFGKVYTLTLNDKEYFYGSAIAKALGYRNPNAAVIRHCKKVEKINVKHPQSKDKLMSINFIQEEDIYRLIMNSKLPNAKEFENWVVGEVLPNIRNRGIYVTDEIVTNMLNDPKSIKATLIELKQERENTAKLTEKINKTEPLVQFVKDMVKSNEFISIHELAKLLSKDGYVVGVKNLFNILRRYRYITKNNIPTQRAIEKGTLVYAQRRIYDNGAIRCRTMVTPIGQIAVYRLIEKIITNEGIETYTNVGDGETEIYFQDLTELLHLEK